MGLITVTELKANWLNIGDSSQDTRLQGLISQAGAIINGICKQPVAYGQVEYQFQGPKVQTHILPYLAPITVVKTEYASDITDGLWTQISGTICVKSEGVYQLYNAEGFNEALYRATLNVGYTDATAPADLKSVCGEMVLELFKMTDFSGRENRLGLNSVASSEGGMAVTTTYKDLTARFKQRLSPYIVRAWL